MHNSFLEKLNPLIAQHQALTTSLEDPALTKNSQKFREISKEYARLSPIVEYIKQYQASYEILRSNEALLKEEEPELQALAQEENAQINQQLQALKKTLQDLLYPPDPHDTRNIFLEIRAAAGGAEAAIFVGDLFRMYSRYAEAQRWKIELITSHPSEQGGFKEIILRLTGEAVYARLKFESGAHRVQRVPSTEAQGRIHTSTCTVAVLPEVETTDEITLNPTELRIDTFRASGAGGQHVQKTDSAIRIVHLPTGLTVECQDERSQHKNRARAMSLLQAKLLAVTQAKQQQEEAATRRSLVGTGDRSERIRTYNFPQSRVTDHRINLTLHQLTAILEGALDPIIDALKQEYKTEQLFEL
jgi:peptide chain release factor 1